MVFNIVTFPDSILLAECDPVDIFDDVAHRLIDNMADTMYKSGGVGLSAPQVGANQRILVYDISSTNDALNVLINPVIVSEAGNYLSENEGCLSLPGIRVDMKRADRIIVDAVDKYGVPIRVKASGFEAAVIQHEVDHLNGVLLISKFGRLKRQLYEKKIKKFKKLNKIN